MPTPYSIMKLWIRKEYIRKEYIPNAVLVAGRSVTNPNFIFVIFTIENSVFQMTKKQKSSLKIDEIYN